MGARAALGHRRMHQRAKEQRLRRNRAAKQRDARMGTVGGSARSGYPRGGGVPRQSYSPPVTTTPGGSYTRPRSIPQETAGRIKEVKPPPSIKQFLSGDTGYQGQLRQFAKALSDFRADAKRRRGTLETEHAESDRALGEQRLEDLDDIEQDFSGRGLLRSGLYGKAVGDYEEEYGERQSDLERRLKQALEGISQERQKFKGQHKLKKQSAREEAIRRRAEKYGL